MPAGGSKPIATAVPSVSTPSGPSGTAEAGIRLPGSTGSRASTPDCVTRPDQAAGSISSPRTGMSTSSCRSSRLSVWPSAPRMVSLASAASGTMITPRPAGRGVSSASIIAFRSTVAGDCPGW
ncbi:hypothetical protein JCM9534A_75020 [Catenuloplanes indicus JCM 9534]